MRIAAWFGAGCCVAALLHTIPASAQTTRTLPRVQLEPERASAETPTIEQADQGLLVAHRTLEVATAASWAATAVFGIIQGYNLPTLFGDGACGRESYGEMEPGGSGSEYGGGSSGGGGEYGTGSGYATSSNDGQNEPIFGDYACRHALSVVHGVLGVTTVLLYTSTDIVGLFSPDPDHGDDLAVDTLSWVSRIGLALTAVAGLIGANPFNMLNIHDEQTEYDFQRTMRTVHMGLAVTGATAYLGRVAIDLF